SLQVCCGAFNMSVGDLVPLATIGAVMAGGMEISRRQLRGEWSNGMLCSGPEVNLGDDHDGILILGSGHEPGVPLAEALGIRADVVYDLEVNPNRPDAMSVAGVARDLAARQGVPFTLPDPAPVESGEDASGRVSVEIVDADLCGRFAVRVLDGIIVGDSPQWLTNRLVAMGMRPVNNVVDVSNYVMLELGQPSHTFDLDRVGGSGFRARWAVDGETIETLDGVSRTLVDADGVVADAEDVAVGIAGVMGGAATEIDGTTVTVALEMAWWDPMSIARTSRRLGLRSEASARFEKGADPEVVELAMRRFAELIGSEAALAPGMADQRGDLPSREPVRVRVARVNRILGTDLGRDRIVEVLEPIGFATSKAGDDLDVVVPSFRPDSATEIDVIEEVARVHGYGRIARTVPRSGLTGALNGRQVDRRRVRSAMLGLGLDEVMPLPFLAPGDLERAGLAADGIAVTNPLVAEESVMRSSLLPGLLKTLAYNGSHRLYGLSLFEVGHVYRRPTEPRPLPDEREYLAVALAGREARAAVEVWSVLADALATRDYTLVAEAVPGLHATRTARIELASTPVGHVGEVDPSVSEAFEVGERVAWLEVDLDVLLGLSHGDLPFRPFSRYPSSDIDLAFEVDEETPAAVVESLLRSAAGDLLVDLGLFDVFRGEPVAEGRRSLAFAMRLQADDRTLTDAEVATVRQRCIDAVEGDLGATLRG
ncbi:MAG: phenylalanine--tRNA ligase subunit beta, partial [Acidimicrobiales bacterium]|nr:phenylalanine--tRNA ligase subunit beta [Acidimicrobiales bacterium]